VWKTINYITDNFKLRVIHGGAFQVTSKKIMILGGLIPHDEGEEDENAMMDNGQVVKLTDQSFFLDVTMGSIKRGPNLKAPSYYINNGGSLLAMQSNQAASTAAKKSDNNVVFALGFRINHEANKPAFAGLAPSSDSASEKPAVSLITDPLRDASAIQNHKKILHKYNLEDQEFTEVQEGVFTSSMRKESVDLDD
jgi:hypothetical protein